MFDHSNAEVTCQETQIMTHDTKPIDNQETIAQENAEAYVPEPTAQVLAIPLECYKYVGGGSAIFQFG